MVPAQGREGLLWVIGAGFPNRRLVRLRSDSQSFRQLVAGMTFSRPISDRYFEDYVEGDVHRFGTIAVEADEIIAFAKRFDLQAMHTDPEAAKHTAFGGLIASGWRAPEPEHERWQLGPFPGRLRQSEWCAWRNEPRAVPGGRSL